MLSRSGVEVCEASSQGFFPSSPLHSTFSRWRCASFWHFVSKWSWLFLRPQLSPRLCSASHIPALSAETYCRYTRYRSLTVAFCVTFSVFPPLSYPPPPPYIFIFLPFYCFWFKNISMHTKGWKADLSPSLRLRWNWIKKRTTLIDEALKVTWFRLNPRFRNWCFIVKCKLWLVNVMQNLTNLFLLQ